MASTLKQIILNSFFFNWKRKNKFIIQIIKRMNITWRKHYSFTYHDNTYQQRKSMIVTKFTIYTKHIQWNAFYGKLTKWKKTLIDHGAILDSVSLSKSQIWYKHRTFYQYCVLIQKKWRDKLLSCVVEVCLIITFEGNYLHWLI